MEVKLLIALLLQCSLSFAVTDYDKAELALGQQYGLREKFNTKIRDELEKPLNIYKKKHSTLTTYSYSEARIDERDLILMADTGEAIKKQVSRELGPAGKMQISMVNELLGRVSEMLTLTQNLLRNESSGVGYSSGSSNSEVKWVITGQKSGGGLAHWYTMVYYVKCTSGRKTGESLTIHHLKSSGKFEEVYGSPESSFAESARRGCS